LPFLSCGSFVAAMAITTRGLMVGAMAWVFVVGPSRAGELGGKERGFDGCDDHVDMTVGFALGVMGAAFRR
jgi:hypothetical protein